MEEAAQLQYIWSLLSKGYWKDGLDIAAVFALSFLGGKD